jgi:hypothetical protein
MERTGENGSLVDARMDSYGRPYGVRQSPPGVRLTGLSVRSAPSTADREGTRQPVRHLQAIVDCFCQLFLPDSVGRYTGYECPIFHGT